MRRFFFLSIFLLWDTVGSGQSMVSDFKSYQVADGLSSNTITCILQDHRGFMWFGSRNGLNRFDGHAVKVFRHSRSDSQSLGSNSILSLCEDRKKQLWVGTFKGIYRYDPQKETFTRFTAIPAQEVRYLGMDAQHRIWIIAGYKLYCYDGAKLHAYPFAEDQATALHISKQGTVWVSTERGRLLRYNARENRFRNIPLATLSRIDFMFAIGDTTLIMRRGSRVSVYQPNRQTTHPLSTNESLEIRINSMMEKSPGEYWIGTESGLFIYHSQTGQLTQEQKQFGNPYSLTDNVISCLYQDREKGIWLGTSFGGVNYYSDHLTRFTKYQPLPGQNSLSGNVVHAIQKDNQGNLWIGTEDAGLNKMNLKTGQIRSFLPGKGPAGLSYPNIHGLLVDGSRLWIGTLEHGLDVMDLKTEKIIRRYRSSIQPGHFTSDFIVTLYKRRNGTILVGTWNGLFQYRPPQDDFIPVPFFNAQTQTIHESGDGTLWVGSYGNGVYYVNERTGKQGHFSTQSGLRSNYITNIYEDRHHQLWICCEGGLTCYNPVRHQFTHYTIENGLPDNQIFRIEEDRFDGLWISTGRGLARFDPQRNQWQHYFTAHGLPTEQFNYNSSFKDTDGSLYFGTVKGLVHWNPASFFKTNRFTPPVYITGLQVNNQEVGIGAKDSILQQSITSTSKIVLSHGHSNVSLDVAALSYTNPQINQYRYMLEGVDQSWIHLTNNRKIYYTNLPAGSYRFRVQGSNNDGIWNPRETVLALTILPPFWATPWAYLLYASLILAIILVIFRYYYLAITEKNKRQMKSLEIETERAIYTSKIEFFTNVAHEIRTPLTLIKLPLDKLLSRPVQDPFLHESLQMMKKHTHRLIDLTNQLLDFRKAEAQNIQLHFANTDINALLNELWIWFKPAADERKFTFRLELPRITLHAYVDEEALRKILSNLLSNAIKYADSSILMKLLPFGSEDEQFRIEVSNDGYRIPAALKDKIFEPFYRIQETDHEPGTGVGLSLSRTLTQLHKGELTLQMDRPDVNCFRLSLPIHQEHSMDFQHFMAESIVTEDEPKAPQLDPLKSTLLLVEDQREISVYIQQEFSERYNVLTAYEGQQALEILQQETIHLVISDIMMPVMDGIELCRAIKSDLEYSHVPVILLTAKTSIQSKVQGLEVGADAYLEKPFSVMHLEAQIESLLSNRNRVKEYFARSPLTPFKGMAHTPADKVFLEQLHQVIYDHILDMELNVDQLSRLMNMSRPTLYRKIKGLSDLSPNELINLARLKKAAELLTTGHYKVNEAAALVGYSLPTNFSRDFQKQFGITPSQYMGELKKK
ncbi:hybrid sensor histidine kinase/response regulator transcription factor [Siphonobacter sp. SORGH_AS_1065]|uniref:hybrid sensor histidine kinase/response regulator transcription factor n=1 Tax=Siphonobacter sp. SORGH_AS_1065 TaxID=3041795 RepID=UPI00278103F0|nr:hybrid sensor histidine kinase/response regulator transcription factor [Siphonobacter sp. SORGH_AS_1065]MDQ1085518.1 ligand-binding sensor domain-containing protein/signal transduction histidine kinase/DNA-binding response OmpR family regulator [Siphonobacter sp. SORGH_AS_1065]